MSDFRFDLLATDGAARRGRLHTAHGRRRHAGLHAGRHRGHGQGADAGHAARDRRADRARQHLPPDAAAGRRAGRAARRPAPLHALAGADPHRFRRLSGDVAGGARGRSTRTASVSARISTAAGIGLRPSARSRSSACSMPTSPWCSTNARPGRRAATRRPRRCAARCAGPRAAGAPSAPAPGLWPVRHRPGRRPSPSCARSLPAALIEHRLRRLCDRRARGRRGAGR